MRIVLTCTSCWWFLCYIQDLQYLSEGLEGRSQNPVSLLFDVLYHPNADIGEFNPSSLTWKHDPTLKCSHVVIGKAKPGGIWHQMLTSTLTLSLSQWLELPMFSFTDWKKQRGAMGASACDRAKCSPQSASTALGVGNGSTSRDHLRASVMDIANYYVSYVEKLGLSENFVSGKVVSEVEKLQKCRGQSPEFHYFSLFCSGSDQSPVSGGSHCTQFFSDCEDWGICCQSEEQFRDDQCYRWKLTTKSVCNGAETVVRARKLVLACGLGKPKWLIAPGESEHFVTHSLFTFQDRIQDIRATGKPVLIVGAGMSAADAVLLALQHDIPLYHAFYQRSNDPSLVFPKLPHEMYGEYHRTWKLMQGTIQSSLYTVLDQHRVVRFLPKGLCEVKNVENNVCRMLDVSAVVVMIGRCASLDFLPDDVKAMLTVKPNLEIDSKHNVVDFDPYSHQTMSCPDLYALGPLAGDNFVRFGFGSGLATAQSLLGLAP